MAQPLPSSRRLAYALGNAGFSLSEILVVSVAVYFYLPPAGRGLEPQVSPRLFLGVLTVFGAAMLAGRLVDMLADPVVGAASDRSRSRLGRRRVFLIWGVGPMVLAPLLLFFPPGPPGSVANGLWLALLLAVYFLFFTVYVAPYLALLPELVSSATERVGLARLMAIASFPVLILGVLWSAFYDGLLRLGLAPVTSMRVVAAGLSALALLLCLGPIWAADERRYSRGLPSDLSLGRAFRQTLGNRPFLRYLAAQLPFVLAITLVRPAGPYIATVVLGRSEGFAAWLGLGTALGAVAGFAWVQRLASTWGVKRTLQGCLLIFSLSMAALGGLRADLPGGPRDALNLALGAGSLAMLGVAIAGFMILPHVLLSQLIDLDERRTGAQRAAIYFGVQGFATKLIYGVGTWGFTFLLSRFGNSSEEPWGVILVGPAAGVAGLVALLLYSAYPEARVLEQTRRVAEADTGS